MKKQKLIVLNFIALIHFTADAQIFTAGSSNESITITPAGISGKIASPSLSFTNTALGNDALKSATGTINNTAIGYKALSKVVSTPQGGFESSYNTAVGSLALQNNTIGSGNSALGYSALSSNISGYDNSAFGYLALSNNLEGGANSAFGANALKSNTTVGGNYGQFNSAFGANALKSNTTGKYNSAMGANALQSNTTGMNNAAMGYNALAANLTGNNNTAFGIYALEDNTANGNTALGTSALTANVDGTNNSAMGHQSMISNTSGSGNVALGRTSLFSNSTGNYNVAIGESALYSCFGSNNVAIGYQAGYNSAGSNKLYIENSNSASPLIGGDFAANKVGINRNLTTNGATDFNNRTENFQVEGEAFKTLGTGNWVIPSDRRLKKDIVSLNSHEILQKVVKMQGVTYRLKADPERGIQYGFIAQELQEIFPDKVSANKAGYLSASYGDFDPMIVEAIKALNDKLEHLERENAQLKLLIGRLNALNEKLLQKAEGK